MKKVVQHISFACMLLLIGCVEEFDPNIEKYEDILVVDGLITDAPGPYTVKLSRSYAYDGEYAPPVKGANVVIFDNNGIQYPLTETKGGTYQTDSALMTGVPGKQYQLYIQTSNGEEYESEFEELKPSPAINKFYYEIETRETNEINENYKGLQFYASTKDPNNATKYYRYSWNETWEFRVPIEYDSSKVTCWRYDTLNNIVIASTEGLSEDIILDYPVTFVSEETERLYLKYSVELQQFSLTRNAYKYLEQLEQVNENMGTLFDPIPSPIKGNIKKIDDDEAPVLGYFMASGLSSRRYTVPRDSVIGELSIRSGFEYCGYFALYDISELNFYLLRDYVLLFQSIDDFGNVFWQLATDKKCVDCTLTGSNKKPYYWDEE